MQLRLRLQKSGENEQLTDMTAMNKWNWIPTLSSIILQHDDSFRLAVLILLAVHSADWVTRKAVCLKFNKQK